MKLLLGIGAFAAFAVGILALLSIRSDIQVIAAEIGLIGGLLLVGQISILNRHDSDNDL